MAYEEMLAESIQMLLSELESGNKELWHFNLMFSRLIETMDSPPMEVIWFYSAVKFQNKDRISGVKELLYTLASSTNSSNASSVAVLAPLTFHLYYLILDMNKTHTHRDTDIAEIGCLIERLVSYISLCCCKQGEAIGIDHDHTVPFSPCFVHLLKLFTFQRRQSGFQYEDDFNMFFPLISTQLRHAFFTSPTVGVLAGIVMCQAFLLNLCFHHKYNNHHVHLLNLALTTITGFRTCYFFDTLLKMLLQSTLPVTTLLTVFDEYLLRQSVFDAIILVDYPFFDPRSGIHLCTHHLNTLASTWLFVAHKAMQFVSRKGDQTKIIAYTNAFSKSLIHYHLFNWASTQAVVEKDANKANLSTPAAFMEWLVQLTNQASRGFNDGDFSLLVEKASSYISGMNTAPPYIEVVDNNQKAVEDGRAIEDLEMIDSASMRCNSKVMAIDIDTCRKRKGDENEGGMQVKLLKYHIHDSPPVKNFIPFQNEVSLFSGARQTS